jgi:hypothetical protein
VKYLIEKRENELRDIAKHLYWHDYLSIEEMTDIIEGKKMSKERVREWEGEKYIFKF